MKNFLRTVVGKTILFLTVLISAVLLFGSACCIVLCGYEGVYTQSEENFLRELDEDFLTNAAHTEVNKLVAGTYEGNLVSDRGNLVFSITDKEGNVLIKSASADETNLDHKFCFKKHEEIISEPGYEENEVTDHVECWGERVALDDPEAEFIVQAGFKEGLPIEDSVRFEHTVYHYAYKFKYTSFVIGVVCFLIMVFSFVLLMTVTARRPKTEELFPGPLNKVPFDIMCALIMCILPIAAVFTGDEEVLAIILFVCCLPLGIGLSMSAAARIKQKNLITGSLTYKILVLCWKLLKIVFKAIRTFIVSIPFLWKTILVVIAVIINLFVIAACSPTDSLALCVALELMIIVPVVLYFAIQIHKLKEAGKALATGDFDYKVNTKGMILDIKQHGDNLNNIAAGQKIALAEKMKSERMKTELITNVSHDIKTPLTSIINYADLIAKEDSVNENVKEYSEVLVRQSVRLKRLLEDLVEASKASTGNLEVELAPCDAAVFVSQTAGEYEEKISQSGLSLITNLPDEEVRIMADGRRMQRVFDNLMNNICKYSLPGTRVYLDLKKEGDQAVFMFKNTSKEPLNMTEEELVERFTRGDSSRNTEGSGLGLSIAKNLVELQGGTMRLQTDGDLFKATISFTTI